MTIYILGNLLLDFDNTPLKLIPKLAKEFPSINFQEIDPSENFHPENRQLVIIDTAEGIEEVKILTDIEKIQTDPIYSAHDFDLGFSLKLLKKLDLLDRVTIFCVPPDISLDNAFSQLTEKIKEYLVKN